VSRCQQLLRRWRGAGDAEQAGLAVQQLRSCSHAHLLDLQQVQQHAGVDRAAARAHHQAVSAEKPIVVATLGSPAWRTGWRRCPGGATIVRPRARAVPLRQRGWPCTRTTGRGSRSADAALRKRARQRQHLLHLGQRAMEGRVEAGHLRQSGSLGQHGPIACSANGWCSGASGM
jgi:hypothetical protein